MKLPQPLIEVEILTRQSRFSVDAQRVYDHQRVYLHLPNTGRLGEVLYPGAHGWYHPRLGKNRKTAGTLVLGMTKSGIPVGLIASNTARLFHEAWQKHFFPEFPGRKLVRMEPPLPPGHRLDLLYEDSRGQRIFVETKSITYVENAIGFFPDAPTLRGRRHLEILRTIQRNGGQAYLVFIVQRADVRQVVVRPDDDPAFHLALRLALESGVNVLALRCRVTFRRIEPESPIPFHLQEP